LGLGLVRVRPWGVARQLLLIHTYTRSTELGPAIRQVGGTTGYPFGPTWTLAVEVSFYVFLPVLSAALVGFTRRRSPRARSIALAGTLLGLGVASLVARATTYSSVSVGSAGLAGSWLLLNLDWFALGMGLAMVSLLADRGRLSAGFVKLLRSRALPGICWTAAVTAYLVVAYGAGLNSTQLVFSAKETMSRQLLYGVIGLSLVLPATLGPARVGVIRRTLGGTPLRQLGLVSYGIYIWQDLVIDQYVRRRHVRYFNAPFWSSLAYVFLGVVAVATVSYFLIERPALALKRRRLLPARSQVPSAR
jgi:peptidoglycan/LPS O-acetylase OafA/YrhL